MCASDHRVLIMYHFNATLRKHAVPSQPSENGAGTGIIVPREVVLPHSTGDCLLLVYHIMNDTQ